MYQLSESHSTSLRWQLPRSKKGNSYILVLVDYATRYPEAVALPSVESERIAQELMAIFSRFGIPSELLTDQGSNFCSELMNQVYDLLKIRKLRTTPYHPQANGLCERFNGTLKTMLRKFVAAEPEIWDEYLPYLLFAYREVPQAATGFSPFELMFGRNVSGPLQLLHDSWVGDEESQEEGVVQYVVEMRRRLQLMTEHVDDNLAHAQDVQKEWFDQRARVREFQSGDRVLVLLPTASNKLQAEWRGPYVVVRKSSPVDYVVNTGKRRRREQNLHVNLLKKWEEREGVTFMANLAQWEDSVSIETPLHPQPHQTENWQDVVIDDNLSPTQKQDLRALLQKYQDILTDVPGRTTVIEHELCLQPEAAPVRQRPYRIPESQRKAVKEELDWMLAQGIIQPSKSPWAAPVVLQRKPDGKLRICIDYRSLNKLTRFDAYPIPRIDDVLEKKGNAEYISVIDLTKGYWQIPLSAKAREVSAFVTPFGQYEFRVMPFGMVTAPATFMRMMDLVLEPGREYSDAYFDDTSIFSDSWEQHMTHLRATFQRIREANLTVRPKKCRLGFREVELVGHVVGKGHIRPLPGKVTAVTNYPTPATKTNVRAFIGTAGYYQKFISDFAGVASPLTDLTKKGAPTKVEWSPECEEAFSTLKNLLGCAPVLKNPDYGRTFFVQTDASDRGLGGVLSQQDDQGDDHPIQFLSRKLLPSERAYAAVEKECLAIVWAVQKLRHYLLGRRFVVQTDHQPLTWLNRVKDKNQRLLRWSLILQEYDLVFQHKKGSDNGNADGLSRMY